jgi:transmembrane sensor
MSDLNQSPDNNSSGEEQRIDEEALDWLIKHDVGFAPEEQDAFFQWLAEDARHGEWFAHHQRAYKQFDSLVQWRPEHSDEPNPDLLATPFVKRRWILSMISAAAAAVLFGLFFLLPQQSSDEFNGFLPEKGVIALSYQIHRLHDGSIVELNKGAQISIRYTGMERRVDLLSGEAYFEVAKNPDRPFIVSARGIDVKAVGTAFNVRLRDDSLEVLVTHGRVVMDSSALVKTSDVAGTDEPVSSKPELGAGQRSLVTFISEVVLPLVDEVSEEEVERELTWKHQVLEFTARPLGEIVKEFNHYNTRQITIHDRDLYDMKITATFRSYNLDGFVRLLELTCPVKASFESEESITLVRDKSVN